MWICGQHPICPGQAEGGGCGPIVDERPNRWKAFGPLGNTLVLSTVLSQLTHRALWVTKSLQRHPDLMV